MRISNAQRFPFRWTSALATSSPAPSRTDYPTLLEFPGPRLLAYSKETAVAEKLQAIVKLGIANTRMKDFYDLEILSRTFAFEGKTLAQAIQNTFQKRATDLPMGGVPVAFTSEFYDDVNKKRQWTAFCAKNKSYVEKTEFKAVMEGGGEDVKTVQELMRHASSRLTLDVYAQALTPAKRAAHLKLVGLIQPATETAIGPLWSHAEDTVAVSS